MCRECPAVLIVIRYSRQWCSGLFPPVREEVISTSRPRSQQARAGRNTSLCRGKRAPHLQLCTCRLCPCCSESINRTLNRFFWNKTYEMAKAELNEGRGQSDSHQRAQLICLISELQPPLSLLLEASIIMPIFVIAGNWTIGTIHLPGKTFLSILPRGAY